MRRVLLLSFAMVLTLLQQVYAQSRTVSGTVTDQGTSQGLPGVAVIVKGTTVGTTTGVDGTYSINVPANGNTLIFRFIGYKTVEREIGSAATINVNLGVDDKQLEEVVVVAYGTADKGSFTGSATQISAEKIAQRPVTNITNAIAGQAAGVQTNSGSGQPGAGPEIRIRGIGSINSSNDPLYVVDGTPYPGSIANLNVDDIESISILKDASSTALYGARATNGVVMITTKKGKKGSNQLNVKISQGVSERAIKEYDRVNAYEYYPLIWEAQRNSLVNAAKDPYSLEDANQIASGLKKLRDGKDGSVKGILGYNPFNVANDAIVDANGNINPEAKLLYDDVDWFEPLQRSGSRSDYALNYSGGSEKSDYFVSLGYLKEKGYVIRSDYERFTGRVNVNTQATDWLRTGLNVSGTITESNQASTSSSSSYVNPFNFARGIGPIYPVYAHDPSTGAYLLDEDGNRIYDYGNLSNLGLPNRGSNASVGRHIVAETMWNDNLYNRNVLSARTFGEVKFLQDFKFTTNLSVDIANYLAAEYDNNKVGDGAPAGRASRTSTTATTYNINQLLNYSKTFNDRHFVEALVGHENYSYDYKYMYGMRQGVIVEDNTELGNFTTTNSLDSRTDKYRVESYLSRLNYTFDDKYTLSGSYRRDGSSRFAKDVRWGDFWSVGASWRLDRETFISMPEWVNMLKLRGSYGEVGNDALLNSDGTDRYYGYQELYTLGMNNAKEPGFLQQDVLGSANLLWESNNSFDIGVEFDLFNRVSGSVEYFNRESENLLFRVPLPLSSGVKEKWENIGTMANTGVEVQLSTDAVKTQDFTWNVNLNVSTFKNELKKLPQEEVITGTKKYMVGKSIYDYWLRDWYGVDPADGAGLFATDTWVEGKTRVINGDTVTTDSNGAKYHYAGSAIPDFAGGITNTFTYKNLSLSVLLTYQVGGKVYDANYASLMNAGTQGGALHKDILNRWQQAGDETDVPRMDLTTATHYNAQSDRWLIDASYLNIRSVNLNYVLPSELTSKVFLKNASVFASGENLALFSKRDGMNVNQSYSGVTSNSYIPARVYTVGLNVTL
ncbi:SusC/RagA family TonB-linked outer membrane protein [Pontibacter actiniarum]|uniref:SusC/RagA family TonB-linked outer membrane protein n=1 Tax=Pontibacter actiniarum TaxID=323450 RepID=A0A1X9YM89_9BACT|nr:TonB-dependent receptor [Pontibacter actiniarum]ARS33979.1 SusC/RagA family TonB-linked outer membrane protein [Pontibacter actiniarum]